MNVTIQRMTLADATALASKTGLNILLFWRDDNNQLGAITPAGAYFHFNGDTSTFVAGA